MKNSSIKIVINDNPIITTTEVELEKDFVTVQDLVQTFLLAYEAAGFKTPLTISIDGLATGSEEHTYPSC